MTQSDANRSTTGLAESQPAEARPPDPALVDAVELARAAAAEEAGADRVGEHAETQNEDGAVTHLFDASLPGYRGWRWAVTVAHAGSDEPVTISEVVLLPGPDALVGQEWVPWSDRVQAGDLGVGDVVLTPEDDERLVPGYLASDDPAVEELAHEIGLGRRRVLSRNGRLQAAERWWDGEYGPRSDMARGAPEQCGSCGFYLPLAGAMRAAFGVCGNEIAPADGRVVHAEYGCGAHSETDVDTSPAVPVAELVYDDAGLDVEATGSAESAAEATGEPTGESTAEPTAESEAEAADEPAVGGTAAQDVDEALVRDVATEQSADDTLAPDDTPAPPQSGEDAGEQETPAPAQQ